jgi:hypothetical protein
MVMSTVNDRSKRAKKHSKSAEKSAASSTPKGRGGPAKAPGRTSIKTAVEAPVRVPGQPLAMRCDGAVLLSVEHFGERSLEGRETWTGVVLHDEEVDVVRRRTENHAQETAARLLGGFIE